MFQRKLWRLFAVIVGLTVWYGIQVGVSASQTGLTAGLIIGSVGAVFAAVAIGSWVASLRPDTSPPQQRLMTPQR